MTTLAIRKIRIGNDFILVWVIERNGVAVDMTGVTNAVLTVRAFKKDVTIPFKKLTNGILIEFTPAICDTLGVYNLQLSYSFHDDTLSDAERTCTVDIDAFEIVPKSALSDDASEFTVSSDLAIAFKGDKGDPFTFDDFTPEQLESLKVKGDKGDAFTYEDFTPEQIESLKVKGDTGPMADVSMAVNESGELIATINN